MLRPPSHREKIKERLHQLVGTQALLKAGISVVAINYRLIKPSEGIEPPVKAPLHDVARALQFVRNKAKEWNIHKALIGEAGTNPISEHVPITPFKGDIRRLTL